MKQWFEDVKNRILLDIKNNGIGLAAVAACLILFALLFGNVCPSQILLGMPCPGCGLTRAGVLVLTGHFVQAFHMHPFIYVWIAFLGDIGYNRYGRGRKTPGLRSLVITITVTMLLYYVYRMYRYFPQVEPMTRTGGGILGWLLQVGQR